MIKLKNLLENREPSDLDIKTESFRESLIQKYPEIQDLYFYVNFSQKILHLSEIRIKSDQRGQGVGRKVIEDIKRFADENNLIITLSPTPERGYKKKLHNFYKSTGFVKNKGRTRDYSISSPFGLSMYRRPKS